MSDTDQNFARVTDVTVLQTKGPWPTKSGAQLQVLFGIDQELVSRFLDFDNPEFSKVRDKSGTNIRGLRVYNVEGIPKDSVGANEYHLARTEIVNVLLGKALWRCEDVYGDVKEFTLDASTSVIVPAGILHTYTSLEDNTRIQVICNTLFVPDDPQTHDSYSIDEFHALQSTINK